MSLLISAGSVSGLSGCAGALSKFMGSGHDLSKELPKEVADKFEVKDVAVLASPTPSPFPSPLPSPIGGKDRKKNKKGGKILPISPVPRPTPTPVVSGTGVSQVPFRYPSRRPPRDPIWLGERQIWDVTYFGVAAGHVTLDVLPFKSVANRKVYHVKGRAVTSSVFSLFYKVDDLVETFIDFEGVFSHRFHILLNETKQIRDSLELNDSEKAQTFYWNKWDRKEKGKFEIKETKPIQPFSQDTLSSLFYLRTLPLRDGDVVTFPVVSEGKTWEAVVTVLGREMVNSPIGRVRAIKLLPETKWQGALKKTGDSFIWLTDDDRRFLLRMEAKVRIGTVVTTLKGIVQGTPPAEKTAGTSAESLQKVN